jgi:hypothetical protein
LPLVLESLPLAFVDVSVSATITPLEPYKRLRAIGTSGGGGLDSYESLNTELKRWIEDGVLPQGSPTPLPAHAGVETDTWFARQDALVSRVEALTNQYVMLFQDQESRSEQGVARAFELRVDINAVLADLGHAAREHQAAIAGADSWN